MMVDSSRLRALWEKCLPTNYLIIIWYITQRCTLQVYCFDLYDYHGLPKRVVPVPRLYAYTRIYIYNIAVVYGHNIIVIM